MTPVSRAATKLCRATHPDASGSRAVSAASQAYPAQRRWGGWSGPHGPRAAAVAAARNRYSRNDLRPRASAAARAAPPQLPRPAPRRAHGLFWPRLHYCRRALCGMERAPALPRYWRESVAPVTLSAARCGVTSSVVAYCRMRGSLQNARAAVSVSLRCTLCYQCWHGACNTGTAQASPLQLCRERQQC